MKRQFGLLVIAIPLVLLAEVYQSPAAPMVWGVGTRQTTTIPQPQLVMEGYNWQTLAGPVFTLRNVGTVAVTLADVFVNGVAATFAISGTDCNAPVGNVPLHASCIITIGAYGTGTFGATSGPTSGVAYMIKVVTADGAIFSYSAIAGQASNPPQVAQTIQTTTSNFIIPPIPSPTKSATLNIPQGGIAQDIFVKNAFAMLAAVTVGILLVGIILALRIFLIVRPRNRGIYDESHKRTRPREVHDAPESAEKTRAAGLIVESAPLVQTEQTKKKCPHCGADVLPEDSICRKCGMPALYLR